MRKMHLLMPLLLEACSQLLVYLLLAAYCVMLAVMNGDEHQVLAADLAAGLHCIISFAMSKGA